MSNNSILQAGFTLFEVLLAITLFALLSGALLQFQQQLLLTSKQQQQRLLANQLAFQLLDIYPYRPAQLIPQTWQQSITEQRVDQRCRWLQVTLVTSLQQHIQQQRLICD